MTTGNFISGIHRLFSISRMRAVLVKMLSGFRARKRYHPEKHYMRARMNE